LKLRVGRRTGAALFCVALAFCVGIAWLASHTASPGRPERLVCPLPDDSKSAHPDMVWVPAGSFQFGDTVYPEEGPVRPMQVQGFWMDRTEVTNAQFAAFVKATGYVTVAERAVNLRVHPDLPPSMQQPGAVVFVMPTDLQHGGDIRDWWQYRAGANWRHPGGPGTDIEGLDALPVVATTVEDAQAYARWKGRQLPSEAQWEWAALGGGKPETGNTSQPAQANTWQGMFPVRNQVTDGFTGVAPVGCFAPNGYGLFDMIGNVWELTLDTAAPNQHVIKGGSYLCAPNYCMRYRPGARQGQEDDLATSHLGFRTILPAPKSQ
jgi:formylglycine-generating enzyme required for sulfatase activity